MTWRLGLWFACIATEVGALVAAVLWIFRRPVDFPRNGGFFARFPLVVLLACALAIDLTLGFTDPIDRSAWGYGLNAFAASGPRPRTPLVRLAYRLADGLAMSWPLAVAWVSGRVFGGEPFVSPTDARGRLGLTHPSRTADGGSSFAASFEVEKEEARGGLKKAGADPQAAKTAVRSSFDLLAGLYLGLVIGMAALYPLPVGCTRWLLWVWEAVCVAAAWAGVARGWPGRGGAVETTAIILVACETMVATVGPFLTDPFTRWWIATAFYLAAFAAVGVVLGRARRPGVS